MNPKPLIALALLGLLVQPVAAQTRAYVTELASGTLKIVDLRRSPATALATVPAGTEPLGVAVERHHRFVFVSNLSGGTVQVFDAQAMPPTLVATLELDGELGGLAASPTADRVYVAKFSSNQVAVIDTAQFPPAVIHTVSAGNEPDGIAFNADGSRAYVANAEDNAGTFSTISVLDATQNPPTVVGTVTVDPEPHGIVVAPNGSILVASYDRGTLTMIDPASLMIVDTLTFGDGAGPYALGLAPGGGRVYVTDVETNKLFAVDVGTNSLDLNQAFDLGLPSVGVDVLPDGKVVVAKAAMPGALVVLDFATNPATEVQSIPVGDLPTCFGKFLAPEPPGFRDGFESGDTSAWSLTLP